MRLLLCLLLVGSFLFIDAPTTLAAPVSVADGGFLFQGIESRCFQNGNCQIRDVITVFANAGNFTLRIAGALVFLMYVIGGIMFLVSRGNSGYIEKGKRYLMTSTIGLVIVFVAYIGVFSLQRILTTGDFIAQYGYVICDGSNDGDECGEASECLNAICVTKCEKAKQGRIQFSCQSTEGAAPAGCDTNPDLCPQGNICCPITNTP